MQRSITRSQLLVLPLVVLAVVVVEEVCAYRVRLIIDSDAGRALAMMALNAVGFTFAAELLSPWLRRQIHRLRKRSRAQAGSAGVWFFFLVAYGLAFLAFWELERSGPTGLLPRAFW